MREWNVGWVGPPLDNEKFSMSEPLVEHLIAPLVQLRLRSFDPETKWRIKCGTKDR